MKMAYKGNYAVVHDDGDMSEGEWCTIGIVDILKGEING